MYKYLEPNEKVLLGDQYFSETDKQWHISYNDNDSQTPGTKYRRLISNEVEQTSLEQLVTELGYEALKAQQKKLDTLTHDQLMALIAYETWKDGQDDWEEVVKIWLGITDFENDEYSSRESIMDELVNTYGY